MKPGLELEQGLEMEQGLKMEQSLELTPFRHLIDQVAGTARPHMRQLFWPIAIPLMVFGILSIGFQSSLLSDLFANPDSIGEAGLAFGGIFLMVFGLIAFYILAFSAIAVASTDAVYGHQVSMVRAWTFPLRLPVLATLILVGAANVLAVLMCLVPVLYVTPVLAFVLPVMIVEGRTGFGAIRRSIELAHFNPTGRWLDGAFLRILAFVSIGMMISYALTLTAQLPFAVAQQIIFFRDAAAGEMMDPAKMMADTVWLQVPAQILNALATAAGWFYWSFGLAMLYREIRRAKEAEDLEKAVDELTGGAADEA